MHTQEIYIYVFQLKIIMALSIEKSFRYSVFIFMCTDAQVCPASIRVKDYRFIKQNRKLTALILEVQSGFRCIYFFSLH